MSNKKNKNNIYAICDQGYLCGREVVKLSHTVASRVCVTWVPSLGLVNPNSTVMVILLKCYINRRLQGTSTLNITCSLYDLCATSEEGNPWFQSANDIL